MKLAISNIAWPVAENEKMYQTMSDMGFTGIEIAPTKLFPTAPYAHLSETAKWCEKMKKEYGLQVASMQSIWYGRTENMFSSAEERKCLLEYTKEAVRFAEVAGCGNLVFGCPRNRNIGENAELEEAVSFFKDLGEYAYAHGTVIGMEANPPIYNTNFINDTASAIALIKEVDSKGFRLNLDFGTVLQNEESLETFCDNVGLINHVHISEPGLEKIRERQEHKVLAEMLWNAGYQGFVSIEMKQQENTSDIISVMNYLREVFA
ncbi:MAG: sugar phosphate isomerase/epimerase [Lachnospiraceae bacterium]|nr:sugar phosphate isomerase/epimerase [Lachnospiraceae bacterium]